MGELEEHQSALVKQPDSGRFPPVVVSKYIDVFPCRLIQAEK